MSRRAVIAGLLALAWLPVGVRAEPLDIVALHPIVGDLARRVGGDLVTVSDLMPPGANPHNFYPSPQQLKEASRADVVLAAGKNLEVYLDDLRQSLGRPMDVIEVGSMVPSLRVTADEVFLCCPAHARGAIDPHWWHSIHNMRRAALALADELGRRRPEYHEAFKANSRKYARELDELYRWAHREIATIPRANRKLTTAHAAFGYLCREMGLRSITVLGLTTEQDPDPGYLKEVIRTLREYRVPAVFPETNANPKVLENIAREAGVAIGGHLDSDMPGTGDSSYMTMVRRNIETIVQGLSGGKENP